MEVLDDWEGQGAFSKPSKRSTQHHILKPPRVQLVARATCGIKQVYNSVSSQSSSSIGIKSYTSKEGHFIVKSGLFLGKRYLVISPVQAFGQSAILIHCQDLYREKLEVIIKVMHVSYYAVGLKEILTLRRLNSSASSYISSHTICLLNAFTFDDHVCLVFPVYNPRPLNQIFRGRELSRNQKISQIRKIALRLMSALAFLSQHRTIHADLKPENILINKDDEIDSIVVADFGNAILHVHKEVALYYTDFELQTMSYRAPEIFIGMPFSVEIDMWSIGCILAELYLSRPLFTGTDRNAVLRQMTALLGPFPPLMHLQGKFSEDIDLLHEADFCKSHSAVTRLMSKLPALKDFQFASFLSGLLAFDPNKRLTPLQAMQHPFLGREFCINFFLPDWSPYSGVISQEDYKFKHGISPDVKRLCPSTYDILRVGTTEANFKLLVNNMALGENDQFMVNSLKKCDELPSENKNFKSWCSHELHKESENDQFMVNSLKKCDELSSENKNSKSLCANGLDRESENNSQELLSSSEMFSQDGNSKFIHAAKPQDGDCGSKLFFPKLYNTHSEIFLSKQSSFNKLTTENQKSGMTCSVQVLREDQKSKLSSCELLRENNNSTSHCCKNVDLNRDLQLLSTSEHLLTSNTQCKSKVLNTSQIQKDNNWEHKDITMKESCAFTNDFCALANIPGVEHTLNMASPLNENSCHLNRTFDSIDLPILAVEIDQFKDYKGSHEKSKPSSPQSLPSERSKVAGHIEPSVDVKSNSVSVTGKMVKKKVKQKDFSVKARHRRTRKKFEACTIKVGAIMGTENASVVSLIEPEDGRKQEDIKTKTAGINVNIAMSSNSMKSQIHQQKLSTDCNFGLQTRNRLQTKKRKCSLDVTYGEKIRYMYTNVLSVQQRKEKRSSMRDGRHRKEKRSICLKAQTFRRKQEKIGTSVMVKSTYNQRGNDTLSLKSRISQGREQSMSVKKYCNKLKSKRRVRENIAKNPRQTDEINFANNMPIHVLNGLSQTQTEASDLQTIAQISLEHTRVCAQAEMSSKHDKVSESEFGCGNPSFQKKNPLEQISQKPSVFQSIDNTICRSGALTTRTISRKVKARRSLWRSSVEDSEILENVTPFGGSPKEVLDSKRDSTSNEKTHPLSRKRLLQVSPMVVKDKSVSDPYEFKVTPAKETTVLCERSKKVKRKSLVAQKKPVQKPQARPKLCKPNEESVSLLDMVQRKTEQFFVRNKSDHDKKRIVPGNSNSSTCESQIPSEAVAVHPKTISLDCFSNEEKFKDCKSAKSLPSCMLLKQAPCSIEKGDKREALTVNEVCSSPCMKIWQNSKKEMNVIKPGEVNVPQKVQINFRASSSVTGCEQLTYAYQMFDDKDKEGDDDIFLL